MSSRKERRRHLQHQVTKGAGSEVAPESSSMRGKQIPVASISTAEAATYLSLLAAGMIFLAQSNGLTVVHWKISLVFYAVLCIGIVLVVYRWAILHGKWKLSLTVILAASLSYISFVSIANQFQRDAFQQNLSDIIDVSVKSYPAAHHPVGSMVAGIPWESAYVDTRILVHNRAKVELRNLRINFVIDQAFSRIVVGGPIQASLKPLCVGPNAPIVSGPVYVGSQEFPPVVSTPSTDTNDGNTLTNGYKILLPDLGSEEYAEFVLAVGPTPPFAPNPSGTLGGQLGKSATIVHAKGTFEAPADRDSPDWTSHYFDTSSREDAKQLSITTTRFPVDKGNTYTMPNNGGPGQYFLAPISHCAF